MKTKIALALVLLTLTGCSTFKSITGQNDDTILPGQREDVLPPDQQTARDPVVTGQQPADTTASQAPCNPNDPNCVSPIDQEAPGQ